MKPTNVLFILSDEHQHNLMGCAGHPVIKTPSLDALAQRGTRFENAYTPSPICVPARASLATGRYVHDIRCWDNAIAYDGSTPGWAQHLSASGVLTESIGKLHYKSDASPVGFRRQQHAVHILDGIGQVWGSVRNPMPETMGRSPLYDKIGPGTSDYNRFDMRVADTACGWLGEHAADDKPWVLFVGLVAPHFPLVVPQDFLDLYDPREIDLPLLHPSTGYVRHPWVERQARHMDHDAAIGSDERRRLAVACYYALVSFLDAQVGKVLAALRASGLDDSTTIIYSSDHGDNLGKRGMWNKCLMYRESTGVPMIVAGPGIPASKVSETPVSLIDIQNTLLECTGCEAALIDGPGKSLVELACAEDDVGRLAFSEYHAVGSESAAYMLADSHYKYHHYLGMKPELFDVKNDPEEMRDLASLPEYADVLAHFERQLRALLDPETTDAAAKADQDRLVQAFGGREAALRTGTPAATPVPVE
ncbi:sulfatase-like hydrolase/transferase [Paraburkholderia phytofirmans]|uniref:Sulfatase n=1 Tax=Paraburkholderia phytofirmans (strain DSM 17436 / LMG 22146 / PsJN) TaxID=398527 RepID=B2T943_PARPJ|nr:sulfatase-like hydrolase/transferase [Paraburkholderia phytofirmans]ACD20945.1 sulfatase [Paraburkholderia phytofirmans PsJN]